MADPKPIRWKVAPGCGAYQGFAMAFRDAEEIMRNSFSQPVRCATQVQPDGTVIRMTLGPVVDEIEIMRRSNPLNEQVQAFYPPDVMAYRVDLAFAGQDIKVILTAGLESLSAQGAVRPCAFPYVQKARNSEGMRLTPWPMNSESLANALCVSSFTTLDGVSHTVLNAQYGVKDPQNVDGLVTTCFWDGRKLTMKNTVSGETTGDLPLPNPWPYGDVDDDYTTTGLTDQTGTFIKSVAGIIDRADRYLVLTEEVKYEVHESNSDHTKDHYAEMRPQNDGLSYYWWTMDYSGVQAVSDKITTEWHLYSSDPLHPDILLATKKSLRVGEVTQQRHFEQADNPSNLINTPGLDGLIPVDTGIISTGSIPNDPTLAGQRCEIVGNQIYAAKGAAHISTLPIGTFDVVSGLPDTVLVACLFGGQMASVKYPLIDSGRWRMGSLDANTLFPVHVEYTQLSDQEDLND